MAKIFLNEGTEIEIEEHSLEIDKLIERNTNEEENRGSSSNFIEVTAKTVFYPNGSIRQNFEGGQEIKLYAKRILFYYD